MRLFRRRGSSCSAENDQLQHSPTSRLPWIYNNSWVCMWLLHSSSLAKNVSLSRTFGATPYHFAIPMPTKRHQKNQNAGPRPFFETRAPPHETHSKNGQKQSAKIQTGKRIPDVESEAERCEEKMKAPRTVPRLDRSRRGRISMQSTAQRRRIRRQRQMRRIRRQRQIERCVKARREPAQTVPAPRLIAKPGRV